MSRSLTLPSRGVQRLLLADEAILRRVRRFESPMITRLMQGLTRAGDATSWIMLGLLLFASGGTAHRHGLLLATGAGLATAAAQVLKRVCRRTRPSLGIRGFTALAENPDTFSFPSGHTCAAVAVAFALAGQGAALGAFMAALAAGVGVSRVYLGAHYPLDVAVGGLLGAGAGILARMLVL